MVSGPVCAMVWEGDNVVATGRLMLGATRPADSLPGTLRGDNCIDADRNRSKLFICTLTFSLNTLFI